MADNLTRAQRKKNMQHIKSVNSKPEMKVRSFLHKNGFRFRLHRKDLPGKPDIVLPKYSTVIFVNGCFWHQHPNCKKANIPNSNKEYWIPKLEKNKARDKKNKQQLTKAGWNYIVIWECQLSSQKIKKTLDSLLIKLFQRY